MLVLLFCGGLLIDLAALVDEVATVRLLVALVDIIIHTITIIFVIGCRCSTTVSIAVVLGTVIATTCMVASDRR